MGRLVVVSNRIADPRKTAAGGLAIALADVLNNTGGLWFGWSGKIVEQERGDGVHLQHAGPVQLATIDLTQADHDTYYLGYSNGVLWPVFHYRLDLADFDAGYIAGYRRVNQLFARKLLPLLRDDDVIWVHDYHLIPLAAELRALGCRQRIGFFLHIPLPPPLILAAIPGHDWLIRALFAYDLWVSRARPTSPTSPAMSRPRRMRSRWSPGAGARSAARYRRARSRSASTSASSRPSPNRRKARRCTSA